MFKIKDHELVVEESREGMYSLVCKYCRRACNPTLREKNEDWFRTSPCYHPENWNKEGAD